MIYELTILAGRVARLEFPASSVVFVVAATAAFDVKLGSDARVPLGQGEGIGNPGSKKYSKATFYNDTASDITAKLWIANSIWKSPDANVNNTVNVTANQANTIAGCADAVAVQMLRASTGAASIVTLGPVGTKFRWAMLVPMKDQAGTANDGAVFLGASGGAGNQGIPVNGPWVVPVPPGAKFNFGDWFLMFANAGDGCLVIYT